MATRMHLSLERVHSQPSAVSIPGTWLEDLKGFDGTHINQAKLLIDVDLHRHLILRSDIDLVICLEVVAHSLPSLPHNSSAHRRCPIDTVLGRYPWPTRGRSCE